MATGEVARPSIHSNVEGKFSLEVVAFFKFSFQPEKTFLIEIQIF